MAVLSRLVVTPLAAIAALALGSSLTAADFSTWTETGDWYVSLGIAPVPEVEEETSGTGGGSTYEWEHLEGDFAPRLALGYLASAGAANGGWALGVEAVFTTCDVTPSRYIIDGLTIPKTSNQTLRYHTAGVTVYGGYQFGINDDSESVSPFVIITPFLGLGAAYGDAEGASESNGGIGWYAEGGLRTGLLLTEKKWVVGVLLDLTFSTGEIDVDFDDGSKSTLVHERAGLTASLLVGYRL